MNIKALNPIITNHCFSIFKPYLVSVFLCSFDHLTLEYPLRLQVATTFFSKTICTEGISLRILKRNLSTLDKPHTSFNCTIISQKYKKETENIALIFLCQSLSTCQHMHGVPNESSGSFQ